MWKVVFYVNDDGFSPVLDFLINLDTNIQTEFAWSIERLGERNITAREPLVHHLEGILWELRVESQISMVSYALIYFFSTDQRIVFLHGYQTKTYETPRSDIETALKRAE